MVKHPPTGEAPPKAVKGAAYRKNAKYPKSFMRYVTILPWKLPAAIDPFRD